MGLPVPWPQYLLAAPADHLFLQALGFQGCRLGLAALLPLGFLVIHWLQ